jgi:OTU domain-containing protein 6
MEELQARQKKELKTFESNRRIALKKIKGTAGKGKKGKEALAQGDAEWDETLHQLTLQHSQQLQDLGDPSSHADDVNPADDANTNSNTAPVSAAAAAAADADPTEEARAMAGPPILIPTEEEAQRAIRDKALDKKLRKRKNAQAKEKAREEQIAKEMAEAPDPRQIEIDAIMELYLTGAKLEIEEVRADGNCLYRAIAKQMELMVDDGIGSKSEGGAAAELAEEKFDFMNMREICAQELWERKEEYEPFADLDEVKVENFEGYVDKVRDSSEWGGHLELRALAQKLSRTIVVYSTEGPLEIVGGNGGGGNSGGEGVIRLSFHKKYYALGEHYNSVVASE